MALAEWDGEERRVARRRPSPAFVMAACAVILALAVGVSQIMTARSAASSSAASADQAASAKTAIDTASNVANRRAITIDGLKAFQAQQACANVTFARFDAAVTRAIIAEPRSAEQAEAVEALRPLAAELDSVNERCVLANPIPEGP